MKEHNRLPGCRGKPAGPQPRPRSSPEQGRALRSSPWAPGPLGTWAARHWFRCRPNPGKRSSPPAVLCPPKWARVRFRGQIERGKNPTTLVRLGAGFAGLYCSGGDCSIVGGGAVVKGRRKDRDKEGRKRGFEEARVTLQNLPRGAGPQTEVLHLPGRPSPVNPHVHVKVKVPDRPSRPFLPTGRYVSPEGRTAPFRPRATPCKPRTRSLTPARFGPDPFVAVILGVRPLPPDFLVAVPETAAE